MTIFARTGVRPPPFTEPGLAPPFVPPRYYYFYPNNALESWHKSDDPCYVPWAFVTCNGTSVVGISMSGGTYMGTLILSLATATIPPELGALTSLTNLAITSNKFSGTIPPTLGALTALRNLEISYNSLTGSVPSTFGSMTSLTSLSAYSNLLTGSLPSTLGALTRLTTLYIYSNALTGYIPTQLGLLTSLTSLYIHNNALSGQLPSELGALTQLSRLFIYTNACVYGPLVNFTSTALGTSYTITGTGLGTWLFPSSCAITIPPWTNANDTAAMTALKNAWCGVTWDDGVDGGARTGARPWSLVCALNGRDTFCVGRDVFHSPLLSMRASILPP